MNQQVRETILFESAHLDLVTESNKCGMNKGNIFETSLACEKYNTKPNLNYLRMIPSKNS